VVPSLLLVCPTPVDLSHTEKKGKEKREGVGEQGTERKSRGAGEKGAGGRKQREGGEKSRTLNYENLKKYSLTFIN